MSQGNDYPLTRPSQELTEDVTTILGLPHSPALGKHLATCGFCGERGICDHARQMVEEIRLLDHWQTCDQCAQGELCPVGQKLWHP